jgi:large subunit ribosomal protein L3
MSGHMGNARATVRNVSLVGIDREAGLVFVNGSVPGPAGGIVFVLKRK